jgi:hypothetical protein
MNNDKQLALVIIDLLQKEATQVDYVLELVTTSFITIDEQLTKEGHLTCMYTSNPDRVNYLKRLIKNNNIFED